MKNTFWLVASACAALAVGAGCGDDDSGTGGAGGDGGSGASTSDGGSGGTGGTGGDGAGGAGGASTMGASVACQDCVADVYGNDATCQGHIQACDADPDCNDWKNCSEDCFNTNDTIACYEACVVQFPHDSALSDPLQACTCDACANDCAGVCASP